MFLPHLRIRLTGLAGMLASALLAFPMIALPVVANAFDDAERTEIGEIVREYLLANPKLMLEVQEALETQQKAEQLASQQKVLTEEREDIYTGINQISIGNPDAPVTVVEFFDYNCGFCRRALSDMNRLVEDGQVRFVLKEFPILSQESLDAHKVSIAFTKLMPEKAAEFHRRLLDAEGRKDGAMALELGVALGADREKLRAQSENSEVRTAIQQAHELGSGLGITGTPSYIIGNEVVFGAIGFEGLSEKIAKIEDNCGKVTC